jgi:hypothetical protein
MRVGLLRETNKGDRATNGICNGKGIDLAN